MAVKYGYLDTDHLTDIGNALNTKRGTNDVYVLSGVAQAIMEIQTGTETADATATSADILTGKTAYVNGIKITGSIEEKSPITETIAPGSSKTIEGGYYTGNSVISASLAKLESELDSTIKTSGDNKTIAPGESDTLLAGKYLTGNYVVSASLAKTEAQIDGSIKAAGSALTIAPGESVTVDGNKFYTSDTTVTAEKAGTTGQISEDLFESKTVDALIDGPLTVNPSEGKVLTAVTINAPSTDATATDTDILSGKTAYVNGQLITGILPAGGDALTEDATALASEILEGKTAYIKGGKVMGTMNVLHYYTGTELPSASEGNVNDLYILTN